MPKILLVNPPFNNPRSNYDRSISVALFSLASYLNEKNIAVNIIDGARQKNYLELIKKGLPGTDFVGLSVMTTQLASALAISKMVKKINNKVITIWGGFHPTFFPEITVKHEAIDLAIIGEGEETLWEIVTKPKIFWSSIRGIAFKNNSRVTITDKRPLLDMKKLPSLNWDLIPQEVMEELSVVPAHTSRGCPHRCTFCVNAILKNSWRARTPDQVINDLLTIKAKTYFQNKSLQFWDENFFVDIDRAKAIVIRMIKENINMPWETNVRASYFKDNFINDEFLSDLKRAKCKILAIGAESGSPKILKKIQKDVTPEEIFYATRQCVKYDITPLLSFMAGLPGETWSDTRQTLDLIDKLTKISPKVQIIGPQPFRPYPGSLLYQECLEYGWHEPSSLEEWAQEAQNELNYLKSSNYPWLKNPDLIESLDAYVRFGSNTVGYSLNLGIKANKLLKLGFILICKLRWKFKFFKWPLDYKLGRKFVTRNN